MAAAWGAQQQVPVPGAVSPGASPVASPSEPLTSSFVPGAQPSTFPPPAAPGSAGGAPLAVDGAVPGANGASPGPANTLSNAHVRSSKHGDVTLLAASSAGWSMLSAYGRGPGSLAFSHAKRCVIVGAALLVLASLLSLLGLCLFAQVCAANSVRGRPVFSGAVAEAVIPVALTFALVVAPFALLGVRTHRPVLMTLSSLLTTVAAVLSVAAGIGLLVFTSGSMLDTEGARLFASVPVSLRSRAFPAGVSDAVASVRSDAAAVGACAIICAVLCIVIAGASWHATSSAVRGLWRADFPTIAQPLIRLSWRLWFSPRLSPACVAADTDYPSHGAVVHAAQRTVGGGAHPIGAAWLSCFSCCPAWANVRAIEPPAALSPSPSRGLDAVGASGVWDRIRALFPAQYARPSPWGSTAPGGTAPYGGAPQAAWGAPQVPWGAPPAYPGAQAPGYPPAAAAASAAAAYPPQTTAYPPVAGGAPGYPPAAGGAPGYPSAASGAPGHPSAAGGAPGYPQPGAYPPATGYPQPGGYPPASGYPPAAGYPPR